MMWPSLLVAFSIGLLSSTHCVAMCGPLALAMPLQSLPSGQRWIGIALYHCGRIGTYAAGGLIFGLAGHAIYLAGDQQILSIGLGVAILIQLLLRRFGIHSRLPGYRYLQHWLISWWASPSVAKFLLLGIGNGLLPCSMVYLALAAALTTHGPLQAAAFMSSFGLGTLPMLLGVQTAGRLAGPGFRLRLRKLLPFVTAAVGVLLILRGLNLGIPFISPVVEARPGIPLSCH